MAAVPGPQETGQCRHVDRGELGAVAIVVVHVFGADPPWRGTTVARRVCPLCAGMAIGIQSSTLAVAIEHDAEPLR